MDGKNLVPAKRARKGEGLRFLLNLVANPPSECVIWPFGKDTGGYGNLRYKRRKIGAHRLAWQLFHGREMKSEAHAAHLPLVCHDKACVNPLHIREATPTENASDKLLDGTVSRGERQGCSKLTAAEVLAIRADTRPQTTIAKDYGVCGVTINDIQHRRTWAWLGASTAVQTEVGVIARLSAHPLEKDD